MLCEPHRESSFDAADAFGTDLESVWACSYRVARGLDGANKEGETQLQR